MKYHILKTDTKSAYMQLYEQLRLDIINGVYPYGTKLPSKRMIAEETETSLITVQHAYAILCEEGYVEARQRSGYFVSYKETDFNSTQELYTARQVIHTNHTKGDFPFSVLAKTMRKVLLDYREEILVKSPNYGCMELREAISAYLARSTGMLVKPEQIIIAAGAEYLYGIVTQLLGKTRIFAVEDPSYEKIRKVYEANDVKVELLKLGKDGIRTSELNRSQASVLHITPFHSFPSKITATASKRQEYLRFAEERDGYLIEDNYDSELTVSKKNEDTVFSMTKNGRVIYINTFSGTIAPSVRVGYMVLPETLLPLYEEKLGFYSCTVPVFEQYVLAELISQGDFERHINRVRRERRKEKQ